MDVGLLNEAKKRVDEKWPYLGPEVGAEIAKVMVAFYLDMIGDAGPVEVKIGLALKYFFSRNRVHRGDRKAFRVMLRDAVRQGEINAWKNGRDWAIDPDDEEKLIEMWYEKKQKQNKRERGDK